MLSMAAIPSAQNATDYYFKAENYYTAEEGGQSAEWHGKGSAALGLKGEVTKPAFGELLRGQLPNGVMLGRFYGTEKEAGFERQHFPGVDMTFSAPKSLSLLAYIGGDKRLLDANMKAVKSTLNWVEENMIVTRIKEKGETRQVKTNSLVAALFPHDISRSHDPQAHIHSIVMNATERPDGKWASVHNPPLWWDSMLVGRIYRSFLGENVRELGYETRLTHRDGRFEIKDVSDQAIDEFSGRSKQIDTLFKTFTHQNTKTRDIAAVMSRSHKQGIARNDLAEDWQLRASKIEFYADKVIEGSLQRLAEKNTEKTSGRETDKSSDKTVAAPPGLLSRIKAFFIPVRDKELASKDPYAIRDKFASTERLRDRSAVSYALRMLSEREASFRVNDIRSEAMNAGVKDLNINGVDREIEVLKKEGLILEGQDPATGMVTTLHALDLEKATIRQMRAAGSRCRGFLSHTDANSAIRSHGLNNKQTDAAVAILSSSSRLLGVQGYAGTGKTRMLRSVAETLLSGGNRFMGLAPTNSAKEILTRDTGVAAQTLQHFLTKYEGVAKGRGSRQGLLTMRNEFKNTTLIVDEASMISSRQMHDLLKISNHLKIPKLVLVGDSKQLSAIEAGKPYKLLQKHGLETRTLDIFLRQKDENLKGAVRDMTNDKVRASFEKLKDSIIEAHPEGQDRDKGLSIAEVVVDLWSGKSDDLRENTLVVAASNRIRKEINEGIRSQLKSEDKITGPEIRLPILENRHLTRAENRRAVTYEEGNKLLFHKDVPSLKIESDSLWTVTKVDHDSEQLHLKDGEGTEQIFRPGLIPMNENRNFLSVFEQVTIDLSSGDKIRWTGNDPEQGIINGQRAIIVNVAGDAVTMKMQDGEEQSFDRDDPILKHLDHGYALTAYAAQGTTFDRVIAALDSSEKMLTNRQTFYVEISRAREHVDLVVDSKKNVMDELAMRSGEKTSALETLYPGDENYRGPFTEREQEVGHELAGPGAEQEEETEFILDMI